MNVMLVGRAFILRDGRILFIQRSFNDRNNPGLWEVPGGKVDPEELVDDTLRREVKEEAGLEGELISPLVAGPQYYITDTGRYDGMLYLPLYAVLEAEGEVSLSSEHRNLLWLTWEEAACRSDLTPATVHMLAVMRPWLHHS